jgi:hypothetical protein
MQEENTNDVELDLEVVLGASSSSSTQVLTLYIPNKDCYGNEFGNQEEWVKIAAEILSRIGGGVTIMPAVDGGWLNEETGTIIWENPIVVYTFIKSEKFTEHLPELRKFLHRLGRETNQREVAVEFDGYFYRITNFDKE